MIGEAYMMIFNVEIILKDFDERAIWIIHF